MFFFVFDKFEPESFKLLSVLIVTAQVIRYFTIEDDTSWSLGPGGLEPNIKGSKLPLMICSMCAIFAEIIVVCFEFQLAREEI